MLIEYSRSAHATSIVVFLGLGVKMTQNFG